MTQDHLPPRKTAADILAIEDTPPKEVYVEEWDTFVTIRGLTKRQQIDIRQRSLVDGEPDPEKSQQGMWIEGVVDPKFTEDQLPLLFEKNAGAIDTVLTELLVLSGMKPGANATKEAAFRQGPGSPVPVQFGAVAGTDDAGVTDGGEAADLD